MEVFSVVYALMIVFTFLLGMKMSEHKRDEILEFTKFSKETDLTVLLDTVKKYKVLKSVCILFLVITSFFIVYWASSRNAFLMVFPVFLLAYGTGYLNIRVKIMEKELFNRASTEDKIQQVAGGDHPR